MMAESGTSLGLVDLEHWMKKLPGPLKDIPVMYLAIPGSHDSMSYGITRTSGLAPDAEPILHNLYPLFRGTIMRWTITQNVDATQQLHLGIRYFDLRLATKTGSDDFYFTHGLYADEITKPLLQIKEFLESHPGEIVILDFQHFYGFTRTDHQKLMRLILNLYGARLCPRPPNIQHVTLDSMSQFKQQVIVVYRHQAVFGTNEFWQPQMMPSPWPRQEKTSGLVTFFKNLRRHPGTGFVHQAVLTPTPGFIMLRWLSNLREKCAAPVVREVLPEVSQLWAGTPPGGGDQPATVNVVIADFVELDQAVFVRTIIDINLKLLTNTNIVYHNG